MIKRNRRGHSYCDARGEILGPSQDELLRKHLPRMFPLIRTKVRGSKAIRYRPSSNHKRCQPAIRLCSSNDTPGSFRETKAFGFRGKYGCKAET
ncbi:hypothetical protein JTE90_021207 [Oedothorax gibbosus]|uniref:Uncharacterized protein n=1 Tax=Oedothorax gibbosus TaxID=931172 RepID=A0AAV6TM39_9ARAC|nr:hypothetical protein JTE90_021207 [Oedothorax gibbosus]